MALLKRSVIFALALCANAFVIYDADDLSGGNLGDECIGSLAADIACHSEVQTFMRLGYRGSLASTAKTDLICTGACSASIRSWFNSVASNCEGKSFSDDDTVPMKFGGYMWAGWNETCVKDPKTKKYCNEIIDEFSEVDSIEEMPRDELCHVCHIRRLAMMQSSQYSIYNEYYKEQLEYVYKTCGGRTGPTDIPPPLKTVKPVEAPFCVTNKRYMTKEGDTCDSIAKASRVSGAALYMGNQELIGDCRNIPANLRLCLPLECETYTVQPEDTCVKIESRLELEFDSLRFYNSWLKYDCSNLQPATDFYGKAICVSPHGGTFTGTVPDSAPTNGPGRNDGYALSAVAPPKDVKVANGTTLNCGKWHVVGEEDSCTSICMDYIIPAGLFQEVNPSLAVYERCTGSLVPGVALCVGPMYTWNSTEVGSALPAETTVG
ncbi:hypothetical protein BHE90_005873 [Fusarium euwallaceae]|uniref:LysM domain-containing protein n=1 Tax=Fusarium euwallaceae TaxID=1147111 RepID=A0A430LV92_9HYPO|nr:hypothetical protein BHE90_005873 [Fusarium euwallaceae]